MSNEDGPFIYINGKFTTCTLNDMIQQYVDGYQGKYDHNSDERPWLTHLIDLLIKHIEMLEAPGTKFREWQELAHHDKLAGDS